MREIKDAQMSDKNHKTLYMIMFIHKFAETKKISVEEAYLYLSKYGALSFLEECFAAEHLLDDKSVLEDITEIAKKNGGNIK
ncbi:MAG: DUF3791 domain-containing protein [Endomicrobium sp.]|jgi:hypothetical protein|nr:DUF3791 domain-containing protein [Endomicrobium sp.]